MDYESSDEISERLEALIEMALEMGFTNARNGESYPFVLVVSGEDEIQEIGFEPGDETLESILESTRELVMTKKDEIAAYAIVIDVAINAEGEESEAIVVEAGERFYETAFLTAQRYRPGARSEDLQTFGTRVFQKLPLLI